VQRQQFEVESELQEPGGIVGQLPEAALRHGGDGLVRVGREPAVDGEGEVTPAQGLVAEGEAGVGEILAAFGPRRGLADPVLAVSLDAEIKVRTRQREAGAPG